MQTYIKRATVVADSAEPNATRVEAIDEDGGIEVAVFSGPEAYARALAFAVAFYGAERVDDETTGAPL